MKLIIPNQLLFLFWSMAYFSLSGEAANYMIQAVGLGATAKQNHQSFYADARSFEHACQVLGLTSVEQCQIFIDLNAPVSDNVLADLDYKELQKIKKGSPYRSRPLTAEFILNEFKKKLEASSSGDQVVLSLINHGSHPFARSLRESLSQKIWTDPSTSCIWLSDNERICDEDLRQALKFKKPGTRVFIEANGCHSGGFTSLAQPEVSIYVASSASKAVLSCSFDATRNNFWDRLARTLQNSNWVSLTDLRSTGFLPHVAEANGGFASQVIQRSLCHASRLQDGKGPIIYEFPKLLMNYWKDLPARLCLSNVKSEVEKSSCSQPGLVTELKAKLHLHLIEVDKRINSPHRNALDGLTKYVCSQEVITRDHRFPRLCILLRRYTRETSEFDDQVVPIVHHYLTQIREISETDLKIRIARGESIDPEIMKLNHLDLGLTKKQAQASLEKRFKRAIRDDVDLDAFQGALYFEAKNLSSAYEEEISSFAEKLSGRLSDSSEKRQFLSELQKIWDSSCLFEGDLMPTQTDYGKMNFTDAHVTQAREAEDQFIFRKK